MKRAIPSRYLTQEEVSVATAEFVLENPNHVKELLYNLNLSHLPFKQLVQVLRESQFQLSDIEIKVICEKGIVQTNKLDCLRHQFNQNPHIPLVNFEA